MTDKPRTPDHVRLARQAREAGTHAAVVEFLARTRPSVSRLVFVTTCPRLGVQAPTDAGVVADVFEHAVAEGWLDVDGTSKVCGVVS